MEEPYEFAHDYEATLIDELPPSYPQIYYPGASDIGGHCECMVLVTPPDGKRWVACFAAHWPAHNGWLYYTPDRMNFCVVCGGAGYIVRADMPQVVTEIRMPITNEIALPQYDLLLFVSYTAIAAYGKSGLAWITDRIALDGITVLAIDNGVIHVRLEVEERELDIDLKTGRTIKR